MQAVTGLEAQQNLPFSSPPDWIIRRSNSTWAKSVCLSNGLNADEYLTEYLRTHPYEVIELDAPDLYHENEPILPQHHWQAPAGGRRVTLLRSRPEP